MDELKAYEPTWRERVAQSIQEGLMKTGMTPYRAMQVAQNITGGGKGLIGGMGLLDATPAGMVFGAQEGGLLAGEGVARAQKGDVGGGLLAAGLGALALTPGGKKKAPREEALETARKNAVKMLGLPENNTAMDRARALKYVDDVNGDLYRGMHQAPTSSNDTAAPAHALNRIYPDDIYSSMAHRYYGHGADPAQDASVTRRMQALRGSPDAPVVVFRAVPKDAPDTINHGDWITPDKQYAVDHGEGALNGDFKVLRDRVPAKTLWTDGNSIFEFGYDKSQKFADGPASIPIVRSTDPKNRERSRFAAFDPARVHENDLLGRADLGLLGLLALGSAGAAVALKPEDK